MMYYIVYGLLYLLSLLPLRVLYVLSDCLYGLIYYVFGYRKAVVRNNLNIAFPEKSKAEKKVIEKKFYRNFIDNFIETLKMVSGGAKFAQKHFHFDKTLIEEQFRKGKSIQFHLGHNFNWELANIAVALDISFPVLAVYMPLKSRVFDRLMLRLRSARNNVLLPATDMKNAMIPFRNTQYLLALIADQVPGDPSKAYWLNFFGRPTPFMRGPERGAVSGDLSVAFAQIYKTRRGQYHLVYELCTEAAGSTGKGELTQKYVRFLEDVIRQHPEMWLWTHRRWKREWKEEYADLWIEDDGAVGDNRQS